MRELLKLNQCSTEMLIDLDNMLFIDPSQETR